MTTDVELKPENASLALSTPVTKRIEMAPRNTRSERILVNNRMVNIVSTVAMVIHALRLKPQRIKSSIGINFYCHYFIISLFISFVSVSRL